MNNRASPELGDMTTKREDTNDTGKDVMNETNVQYDDDEVVWRDDRVRWAEDFENEQQLHKVAEVRSKKEDHDDGGDKDEGGEEEEDEESALIDPFKDPDPFQIFEFDFEYPFFSTCLSINGDSTGVDGSDTEPVATNGKSPSQRPEGNNSNISNSNIHISLRGYKKDADQVWQSTGVTLWRASEYLCQYLLRMQIKSDEERMVSASASAVTSSFLKGKRILEVSCYC